MGSFSIFHWLIVLALVLLIFGTRRVREAGQDLGAAFSGFKKALKEAKDVKVQDD